MNRAPGGAGAAGDVDILRRLARAPELFAAIAETDGTELQIQSRLREQFPPELVRAALEQTDLRHRACEKFSRASDMWFTRAGLEQATPEAVAIHKATRFSAARTDLPILDLCCGIGGDALAIAAGQDVVGVDLDPANLLRAELNVAAYGHADRFNTRAADVTTIAHTGHLVHLDPDRRHRGERSLRIEQMSPPLEFLQALAATGRGGAIKLSPASNFGGKFPAAEIELVSLRGECKEATVWFGELRGDAPWRATALPSGETIAGHPLAVPTDVRPPGRYVFDPDPAVVRAGLVDLLAAQLNLWRLDDAEEYLTGDTLAASPFVAPFELLDTLPHNDKAVRHAVREAGLGIVEIKCRHLRIDPALVRRKLPLAGTTSGVLIYARVAGKSRVLRCRRPALPQSR